MSRLFWSPLRQQSTIAVLGLLIGCHPAPSAAPASEASGEAWQPAVDALDQLLPAPGVRWLLRLRPQSLLADELLLQEAQPLVSQTRLKAFQAASGLDPRRVRELWLGGYPMGTLLLVDGSVVADSMIDAFERRARSTERKDSADGQQIWLTGVVEGRPQALYAVRNHLVAIADGDPSLAKIVRAHAQGRLAPDLSALRTRFMRPVASVQEHVPAALFLFGPYEDATDVVMSGFVAGTLEFEHRTGSIIVRARARGVWEADSAAIGAWLLSLLLTPELSAFGLDDSQGPPSPQCDVEPGGDLTQCAAEWSYAAADLARSTYLVTQAPMAEILALPEEEPPKTND